MQENVILQVLFTCEDVTAYQVVAPCQRVYVLSFWCQASHLNPGATCKAYLFGCADGSKNWKCMTLISPESSSSWRHVSSYEMYARLTYT